MVEENRRLKRAVEELSILNDLARAISASLNTQEIIQTIVRRSLRALNAEQGVVTLIEEQSAGTMKTLVRTMMSSDDGEQYHFNQSLLGWMHLNKKPIAINNPNGDDRFRGVQWDSSINSLLAVPITVRSELRGVLTVYNKKNGGQFSDNDQRLLAIIAAQSGQVVENARLNEREQALTRMQEEVRLASRIQLDLLPKEPPSLPGYEIVGSTMPAQAVGGDYFDFISIDDHRLAFCLGDVSGKGLPASLLMANLQATLRGQTLLKSSPKECLERSNFLLFQSTSPEKFATLFYGILDTQTHSLSFSNAGHDPPYVLRDGAEPARLIDGGIPLAIFKDFSYEQGEIALNPGDTLALYSDGITEAMNAGEEHFGEERLAAILLEHSKIAPRELMELVLSAARAHAGTTPQSDDMTLVIIKRMF